MSRPPNEVYIKASLFKRLWEAKYIGEEFVLLGEEFKWAKELLGISDTLIEERWKIYAQREWYGQESRRHSLYQFIKHFNEFVPTSRRRDGTWKQEEPMPIAEVRKLFEPMVESMSAEKKQTDPNEKYRCPDCHDVHSPNKICMG